MGLDAKVYKNFITGDQVEELKTYALDLYGQNLMKANPNGPYRFGIQLNHDHEGKYFSPLIINLFNEIAKHIGISKPAIDPMLGVIVSIVQPNGFIHRHKDPYTLPPFTKNNNIRFNLMVERGEGIEYNPIINDAVYDVQVGDGWVFNASKCWHETKAIPGPQPRIVYQFGFMI